MKKLTISAENCLISKNSIGDIRINDKDINTIIHDNLPNIAEFKNYPAKVFISIEFLDTDLNIDQQGYANKAKLEEEEEED